MMDILYIIALALFIGMTFIIVRNYYSNKFNKQGQRKDMIDSNEDSN